MCDFKIPAFSPLSFTKNKLIILAGGGGGGGDNNFLQPSSLEARLFDRD